MSTQMFLGDYRFSPVPLMTLNKTYEVTDDGAREGTTVGIVLEGVVTPTGDDGVATGLFGLTGIVSEQDKLIAVTNIPSGQFFQVMCDDVVVISGYPIVRSLNFTPTSNNWVQTSSYTMELEYFEAAYHTGDATNYYISDINESWNVEFSADRFAQTAAFLSATNPEVIVTHNVAARGKSVYDTDGLVRAPWQEARRYVLNRVVDQPDSTFMNASGLINISGYYGYNHLRTNEVDILGGMYSATETWYCVSGTTQKALEDTSISINSGVSDGLTRVTVEGTIHGLQDTSYGSDPGDFNIVSDKYTNATGHFATINPYARANGAVTDTLNLIPLNTMVAHNPAQGTITYTYDYDNRRGNCIAGDGVLSEVITIIDSNPTDVFAQLVVCGRARGPVLQDIGTVNVATREASVEVVVRPTGLCTNIETQGPRDAVHTFLATVYSNLVATSTNAQVFKHQDQESWNPTNGRYSRRIGWTYQNDSTTKSL